MPRPVRHLSHKPAERGNSPLQPHSRPTMESDALPSFVRRKALEKQAMWRALFLGIGIYMMIAGAQCLAVDRVVWRGGGEPAQSALSFGQSGAKPKEAVPEPWIPWCLLSSGAVVCLYSFTIPKRIGGGGK